MPTDYDAPRQNDAEEIETDSLEGLQAAEVAEDDVADTDDGEIVEPIDVPMVDYAGEEFSGTVVPKQRDEFTCVECFLVQHRSRIGEDLGNGEFICDDCA